jgi:geranylgeranylglycerol-phosphate geranylgeranyltransferase
VHPVLRLARAGNALVSFFGTVVGGLLARGLFHVPLLPTLVVLVLAGGSTAFVTAGGNALNDVLDRESDRRNHPDRPLVTGALTVGQGKAAATAFFLAGGLVALPLFPTRPLMLAIIAIAVAVLLGYEFLLKARGFSGNLLVAFLTGAVFLYGGAAVFALPATIPFAVMAFFATLSRELIKDMEDAGGDLDRRTLPQTHGFGVASGLARSSVAVAVAASPVPLLWFLPLISLAGIMYLALVLAADGLFVLSVVWLPARLHREQTLSKGAMTVALLAFLAVAFR